MSDTLQITAGSGTVINTDEIGGTHTQRVKATWGADGTVTDVSAASPMPVQQYPVTSGGLSKHSLTSAATTNPTSVKGSAGQVYHISCTNNSTSPLYFKMYNTSSAPVVGTTPIVWRMMIPAGGGFVKDFLMGMPFTTGIAYGLTATASDAGTGTVGANQVYVNLLYA